MLAAGSLWSSAHYSDGGFTMVAHRLLDIRMGVRKSLDAGCPGTQMTLSTNQRLVIEDGRQEYVLKPLHLESHCESSLTLLAPKIRNERR